MKVTELHKIIIELQAEDYGGKITLSKNQARDLWMELNKIFGSSISIGNAAYGTNVINTCSIKEIK
jgi:hypothetical protein